MPDRPIMESAHDVLSITTLGAFSVARGDKTLSEDARRSQKIWTLFKYILTDRKRHIPAEEFFSVLWPDEECISPQKALQNLIYRLRNVLSQGDTEQESCILFAQGCYYWNQSLDVAIDCDQFEEITMRGAAQERSGDAYGAIQEYKRAATLYRGPYLSDIGDLAWVKPQAESYSHMYLNAMAHYVHLLRALRMPDEAVEVCEGVFRMHPYDETMHACYIDALMDMGKVKRARSHYEYITTALYRELGVRPSQELKNTFRRVNEGLDHVQMDLEVIQELLSEKGDVNGAYVCESDMFRAIYKLEARRAERTGQVSFLVVMTLLSSTYSRPEPSQLSNAMDALGDILGGTLRRGDVVARWNESQFVMLLPTLTFEDGEMVLRRLENRFLAKMESKGLLIKHKLQPVSVRPA